MATNKSHSVPSEMARLVLGYLNGNECPTAAKAFLEESKHLAEYKDCLAEGIKCPLTIDKKKMRQILNRLFSTCFEPKPGTGNLASCDKSLDSCLLSPPPTTPRRTPPNASSSWVIKSNSQRVTPEKDETRNKLTRAENNLTVVQLACSCNNEMKNISCSGNVDWTTTPSKQSSVHVVPNFDVGELMSNPVESEKLEVTVTNTLEYCAYPTITIEDLTSGSWATIAAPELQSSPQQQSGADAVDFVPEPNDGSICLQKETVQNIMSEFEENLALSEFDYGVLDNLDLEKFGSIGGSSPIAGTKDILSSSLSTPKDGKLYHYDHTCYSNPVEFSNYSSSLDVVKNLFTPIKGPEAFATHVMNDQFYSSPLACARIPFVEPPITPGKLVTLDFEMLTASPQPQPLFHALAERKATERKVQEIVAAKPTIAPKGNRNDRHTIQPYYVPGRPGRRAKPASGSVNFTDQSSGDTSMNSKGPSFNETRQVTRPTSITKAKSSHSSTGSFAIALTAAQIDLLKNIDSNQINEIVSRAHAKSS